MGHPAGSYVHPYTHNYMQQNIPRGKESWNPTLDKERQGWGTRQDQKPVSPAPCGIHISCLRLFTWHILMYMPISKDQSTARKAKVFMNNRSQAVRLPKEFQFRTQEVFIRKEGSEVVLSPRPFDWSSYLADAPAASASFMEGVEDLPMQERER